MKKWKEQNIERKTQSEGFNSFIAKKPLDEFQIDFFINDLPNPKFKIGTLIVDIFLNIL